MLWGTIKICGYIEYDGEFLEEMMALQLDEESPDEEVELSENCTANVNENEYGESDEDNYSEENERVESDDDEINVVDL